MNKQPYQELLQLYKNAGESSDTFEFHGEKLSYPRWVLWSIKDDFDVDASKSEYRSYVTRQLFSKKTEEELLNLPCKEKLRRYSKNAGLELLASTLEAVFVPLMIGGISVRFNGLRERKEETYSRFINEQQDITDKFYWNR